MSMDGYTTAEHALHELRLHLERIGKANEDEFGLSVAVDKQRDGQTIFCLRVYETTEDHTVNEVCADTITEAATATRQELRQICEGFNYDFVE